MSCLICAGPAERIPCAGSWEECKCSQCGHYRIADALVLSLMEQGQIFDIPKVRAWLALAHSGQGIPSIEQVEGLLRT
ncbi:MAG: hypothetical protein PW845_18000 [Pseudomonas sp.]|uniref:hypothetical protein n=1 Tax=Pseudomonas abieticivorans TaxID=2931382 RepID=UPI0020BDCA58|nr:hypothetical protein [Pseudomonas sp. PIA16]MDE1167211.1 hypothetical protein [Pseudomonas sp.]